MGCLLSKRSRERDAEPAPSPKYSWEKKEQVDRSQLIISDEENAVLGRLPGQLNGKQFLVHNCKNCTILVLDYTETVTIEKCADCHILIAPCKGSVYIRECTGCVVVAAAGQFRARDCKKCDVFLYSATQPVIESSSGIKFGCFQCTYPQLTSLFTCAGLSVFNNQWSIVHDFDQGVDDGNWSLLPEETICTSFILEQEFAEMGISFTVDSSAVPFTVGPKQKPPGESCLVAFFIHDDMTNRALDFVRTIQGKAVLVLTRQVALQNHEAETLFTGNAAVISNACKGECILLLVGGTDCLRTCRDAVGNGNAGNIYISPSSEQGQQDTEAFLTTCELNLNM